MICRGIRILGLALLGVLVVGVTAADEPVKTVKAADGDAVAAFDGMHREAVAVLLGPPHKVKRSRGQETLLYTLRQVGDDYLPSARERLFVVPGRGPCIAVLGNDDGIDDTLTIEPTRTDDRGRPISGGPTSTLSRTIDLSKGERADKRTPDSGRIGRKLKLRLVLDGDHVASWTVTP